MRKLAIAAALAAALVPTSAGASEVGKLLGFHRCYFEVPARPVLRNEMRLVLASPGYWENVQRPSAYSPLRGSAAFFHHRPSGWEKANEPRAERTTRLWHEPIYMKVTEPTVIDPGRALLVRADNCWPN